METTFEKRGLVGVMTVAGPINAASVDTFRAQFLRWWDGAPELRHAVLDLGEVEFIDSSGLGAAIALLKRVAERGGDLKLCGMNRRVRMVFEITRAHRVFDILNSVDDAVRSCV